MIEQIASSVERYMDLLSVRQKLVASNIANLDTPGYRTRDISFQQEFQKALSAGMTVAGDAPETVEVAGLYMKNDGNNVSIDRESRLLAENALRFNVASNLARSELKQVRLALDGGNE
jgi:flagellar basal-body rod protein FlgB